MNDKLRDEKSILARVIEEEWSEEKVLREIYMRALSRFPTEEEKTSALAVLAIEDPSVEDAKAARRQAFEDLTWAVLSSKEFLFNH